MRISRNEMITNVPILKIRDYFSFLRNYHITQFTKESICNYLKISKIDSDQLIKELLEKEYIQKSKQYYELTLKGSALSVARCVPTINKEKADKILHEFIKRVEEVNTNDYYLYKVKKILLFGSYINPSSMDFADIDIAFELERKEKDPDKFQKQDQALIKQACKNGKSFSSFIDELFYSERLVLLKLKNRNQYISLHRIGSDDILKQTETKQIYSA